MSSRRAFELLAQIRDRLQADLRELRVVPEVEPRGIRRTVQRRFDLRQAAPLESLLDDVVELLRRYDAHGIHPRSFGLFHSPVRDAGVIGEALAALFNPQLATWSQAPAAVEIESFVLAYLAGQLGYPEDCHLTFTSGGLEANLSAVCAALARAFPEVATGGLRSLDGNPLIYLSHEAHHSFEKIARTTGLGSAALRRISVDSEDRLDLQQLQRQLAEDRAAGDRPFLLVATAGTTISGAVDPIPELTRWARSEGVWCHVDAAWAGSAVFSRSLADLMNGIEHADSITWDAHKWLWAPLNAGMFFCRRTDAVRRAFDVNAGRYIPRSADAVEDPYATTFSWSRRFRGLKVFLTLAELGEAGVRDRVEAQIERGSQVRDRLREAGFEILNRTGLPLICFRHPTLGPRGEKVPRFLRRIHGRGRVWVSPVGLSDGTRAIRCCITSPETTDEDVDVLLEELMRALPADDTHEPDASR